MRTIRSDTGVNSPLLVSLGSPAREWVLSGHHFEPARNGPLRPADLRDMTAPNPYDPRRPMLYPPPLRPRRLPPRRLPPGNSIGAAGLVLGIIALVFALIPIIGVVEWFIWPIGLVVALIGFGRVRSGEATNRGPALAGVITSGAAAAVCLLWLVITAVGAASRTELSATPRYLRPRESAPAARPDHRGRACSYSTWRRRCVGRGRHL